MAQFNPALNFLLNFEDAPRSYAPSTDNNGGHVIAGINSKSFPQAYMDIASLPVGSRANAVAKFYFSAFWNPMQIGGIESQDLANRVLDMGVNAGPVTSIRLLQRAVNALRTSIAEDGKMGPETLEAVNCCNPDALLASFRSQRDAHYAKCEASPELHKVWHERAIA